MAEKTIVCPHCQQQLTIDEEYIGMAVECPTCNQSFTAQDASSLKNTFQQIKNFATPPGNPEEENLRQMQLNSIDTDDPYALKRLKLVKFFAKAECAETAKGLASLLASVFDFLENFLFIFTWIAKISATPTREIVAIFKSIQNYDIDFLKNLNILPKYGKNSSQLVTENYTLFSPAIDYEAADNGPQAQYTVTEDDDTFLYNLEEVTKIYTFEDQLFVFKAYWDYTTGKLFDESTEAFFFKDISDILTKSNYEYTNFKVNNNIGFWEAIKKYILFILLFTFIFAIAAGALVAANSTSSTQLFSFVGGFICIGLLIFFISSWCVYQIVKNKTARVLTKKSETFIITANSGNSTGMTILCDEWVEAQNGVRSIRTNGEKIIHAIRKMIEEKKVSVNE